MQYNHDHNLAALAAQVRRFYHSKKPFYIYHGSTNSTRLLAFKRNETIDISGLRHILSVDSSNHTAWVEPNVPMDALVKTTLKYGLIPKVVMEFPGITVGGGIQGGAGESSSFRYGCFNQICNSYEMVVADGSVVHTSPTESQDLFYGTAGSFGTLGIITAAEVQLLPAKRYVRLTYFPVGSFEQAVDELKKLVKQRYEYLDGIMFSKNQGVIIAGRLSNEIVGKRHRFSRAHNEWYYLHVQKISRQRRKITETVPITDYLFRYDRGGFWVGRYAFEIFGVPFNRCTRWLFNPFFHTRKLYEALQASGASQQFIVQDLALPENQAVECMNFIDESLHIYPLWLCPLKPDDKSPFQSNNLSTPLIINIGVWGNRILSRTKFIAVNRSIEQKLHELGGKKWFYAHSYYTEDEFWRNYDKVRYNKLRRRYHAQTLPTIFDKIRVKDYSPIELKKGAYRAMQGRAKLRIIK